ncbi:MAG: MtrB/PioB family decaheme-associated outer membrane protein [Nevskia sp.]|nr:MtrB/PioB family decaheme-associated outer membrane protein [Nevskia sp.]
MSKKTKQSVTVLASAFCILPFAAVAQSKDDSGFDVSAPAAPEAAAAPAQPAPVNQVRLGGLGVFGSANNWATFGKYNGLKEGGGATAGWTYQDRDAWDSGTTHYFVFTGDNVDFQPGRLAPEASLNLRVGEQGHWGISAGYDAMTYWGSDHFTSILDNNGNLSPGFKAKLTPTTTNGLTVVCGTTTNCNGTELTTNVGTRRDKGMLGWTYHIGHIDLSSDVVHEHKEGTLEQAMTTAGSNTGFISFPMPINYDTDTLTVAAAYNTERLQAKLAYEFSNFSDNNGGGFGFQPWNFKIVSGTQYPQTGVYSLPPSNQAHTITGEAGYNLTPTTRVSATMVYSLQLQDDGFVNATNDPYVTTVNKTTQGLLASNPGSLDGIVQTYFGSLAVTTRPLPKLDIRASYTTDLRDPQTQPMFIYGDPTDTASASTPAASLKFRQAVPESWAKQAMALTAGYHLLPSTRLQLGYTYKDTRRDNAITRHAKDNEETFKVNTTFLPNTTGSLALLHANRTASAPDFSLWTLQIVSDCYSAATNLLGCQEVPFYEAARTEDSATLHLATTLHQKLSLSLFGKYTYNHYHDPNLTNSLAGSAPVGTRRDYSAKAGPDLAYRIDEDREVHLFYSFLRTYRSINALASNTTAAVPQYYYDSNTYDIHTAGVGTTWRLNTKVKLGADYTYSYGNEAFTQSFPAAATNTGDPLLGAHSSDNQFKVYSVYDYSKRMSVYLGYRFDSLDMTDWTLPGMTVGQVITGDLPARYNVSTVNAAFIYKF